MYLSFDIIITLCMIIYIYICLFVIHGRAQPLTIWEMTHQLSTSRDVDPVTAITVYITDLVSITRFWNNLHLKSFCDYFHHYNNKLFILTHLVCWHERLGLLRVLTEQFIFFWSLIIIACVISNRKLNNYDWRNNIRKLNE